MNKYDIQRARVENIKRTYPPGTRIELISMSDPYAPVPSGTKGTVSLIKILFNPIAMAINTEKDNNFAFFTLKSNILIDISIAGI